MVSSMMLNMAGEVVGQVAGGLRRAGSGSSWNNDKNDVLDHHRDIHKDEQKHEGHSESNSSSEEIELSSKVIDMLTTGLVVPDNQQREVEATAKTTTRTSRLPKMLVDSVVVNKLYNTFGSAPASETSSLPGADKESEEFQDYEVSLNRDGYPRRAFVIIANDSTSGAKKVLIGGTVVAAGGSGGGSSKSCLADQEVTSDQDTKANNKTSSSSLPKKLSDSALSAPNKLLSAPNKIMKSLNHHSVGWGGRGGEHETTSTATSTTSSTTRSSLQLQQQSEQEMTFEEYKASFCHDDEVPLGGTPCAALTEYISTGESSPDKHTTTTTKAKTSIQKKILNSARAAPNKILSAPNNIIKSFHSGTGENGSLLKTVDTYDEYEMNVKDDDFACPRRSRGGSNHSNTSSSSSGPSANPRSMLGAVGGAVAVAAMNRRKMITVAGSAAKGAATGAATGAAKITKKIFKMDTLRRSNSDGNLKIDAIPKEEKTTPKMTLGSFEDLKRAFPTRREDSATNVTPASYPSWDDFPSRGGISGAGPSTSRISNILLVDAAQEAIAAVEQEDEQSFAEDVEEDPRDLNNHHLAPESSSRHSSSKRWSRPRSNSGDDDLRQSAALSRNEDRMINRAARIINEPTRCHSLGGGTPGLRRSGMRRDPSRRNDTQLLKSRGEGGTTSTRSPTFSTRKRPGTTSTTIQVEMDSSGHNGPAARRSGIIVRPGGGLEASGHSAPVARRSGIIARSGLDSSGHSGSGRRRRESRSPKRGDSRSSRMSSSTSRTSDDSLGSSTHSAGGGARLRKSRSSRASEDPLGSSTHSAGGARPQTSRASEDALGSSSHSAGARPRRSRLSKRLDLLTSSTSNSNRSSGSAREDLNSLSRSNAPKPRRSGSSEDLLGASSTHSTGRARPRRTKSSEGMSICTHSAGAIPRRSRRQDVLGSSNHGSGGRSRRRESRSPVPPSKGQRKSGSSRDSLNSSGHRGSGGARRKVSRSPKRVSNRLSGSEISTGSGRKLPVSGITTTSTAGDCIDKQVSDI